MTDNCDDAILARFSKNAVEEVRITQTVYYGIDLVDVRVYYQADNGDWRPSKKGLTVKLETFPVLAASVLEACDKLGVEPSRFP